MEKMLNIGKLLEELFAKNRDEDFVVDAKSGMSLTYGQFFEKAVLYAGKLKRLGIGPGKTAVLALNNSMDLFILYIAGLLSEARLVPVDPFKGVESIKEVLGQIDCEAIIVDGGLGGIKSKKKISLEKFKKLPFKKESADENRFGIFNRINYEKPYLISFTSGSTGVPKGVIHSFGNLIRSALNFGNRFGFGEKNVFYHNLPMTYMAGILNQLLMPFICGSRIVIGERFGVISAASFWDYPIKYSVNTFWINPTILSILLKLDRGTKGIRFTKKNNIVVCVGTAPLDYRLRKKIKEKYKIKLYESYGLSETLFISAEDPLGKRAKGSVGTKFPGVKLSFAPDGEIIIEAEWMFLGYVGQNAGQPSNSKKFLSGDIGLVDKNNLLHITGRKKDLIIRGGINISPKKIEDFISELDYFGDCVIIGMEDEILGEKVVCFYENKEDFKDEAFINRKIVEKLGRDYRIDKFIRLKEIPKNVNGKVNKLRLKKYKIT
jgi:long-chain acyl-CoA synthetase